MAFRNIQVWCLILMVLCSGTRVLAQTYVPIEPGHAAVISVEGLVLRSGPSKQATRLEAMSFGSVVEVLDSEVSVLDSLPPLQDAYFDQGKWIPSPIRRIGHWVKVRYNGRVGYAFDAFLVTTYERGGINNRLYQDYYPADINSQFLLLEAGVTCNENFVEKPGWIWYGVYYEKGLVTIRPAVVRQFAGHIDEGEYKRDWLYTCADDNAGLFWLLGSKAPMHWSSHFPPVFWANDYSNRVDYEDQIAAIYKSVGLKIYSDNENGSLSNFEKITYTRGGVTQQLNLHFGDFCSGVEFIGDFDGDRKHDFIISLGDESRYFVLFLSSQAKAGELVHAVATFSDGYCC